MCWCPPSVMDATLWRASARCARLSRFPTSSRIRRCSSTWTSSRGHGVRADFDSREILGLEPPVAPGHHGGQAFELLRGTADVDHAVAELLDPHTSPYGQQRASSSAQACSSDKSTGSGTARRSAGGPRGRSRTARRPDPCALQTCCALYFSCRFRCFRFPRHHMSQRLRVLQGAHDRLPACGRRAWSDSGSGLGLPSYWRRLRSNRASSSR